MNRIWWRVPIWKMSKFYIKTNSAPPKMLALFIPAFAINKTAHCLVAPKMVSTILVNKDPVKKSEVTSVAQVENHLLINRIGGVISNMFYVTKLCLRCIKVVILFIPPLLLFPFSFLHAELKHQWWRMFLFSIQLAGPVLIKLGQWASTRRDIFSVEVCNYLSSLQHSTRPHAWHLTVQAMDEAFGSQWKDIFVNFEAEPYGSGCVAQVHKSYIHRNHISSETWEEQGIWHISKLKEFIKDHSHFGSNKHGNETENEASTANCLIPVAVKVIHPGIHEEFEKDLTILRAFAKGVELLIPSLKWLSLTECVEEFKQYMLSQIDMVNEAAMLDKFCYNFKDVPTISFPRPVRPFVSKDVLVETWEVGEPISSFLSNNHPKELKNKIAVMGMDMLLKMIFMHNFVHGDLHAGNILVQDTNVCDCNKPQESDDNEFEIIDMCDVVICSCATSHEKLPKLVILDCGLVSALPPEDFSKFYRVFRAVVMDKGEEVGELFLQHSVNKCKNPDTFKVGMKEIVSTAMKDTLSLKKVEVGKLLHSVFSLLATNHVKLESNFLTVILAVMVLEGLGRSLDPTLDLLQQAKPYLLNPLPHL